jgi:hypothetical protein
VVDKEQKCLIIHKNYVETTYIENTDEPSLHIHLVMYRCGEVQIKLD